MGEFHSVRRLCSVLSQIIFGAYAVNKTKRELKAHLKCFAKGEFLVSVKLLL